VSTALVGNNTTGLIVNSYVAPAAADLVTGASVQTPVQGLANDLQNAFGYVIPVGGFIRTLQFSTEAFYLSPAAGATIVFDGAGPSVWTDNSNPPATDYMYFNLGAPAYSVLIGVTAEILPAGAHGALPATKPRISLVRVNVSTNTATASNASDNPANVAAYEAQHSFTLAPTLTNTAWTSSTAYSVGDFRTNSGRLFVCVFAGTSASSGGPTVINGQSILDGTAVWAYAGGANGYVVNRAVNRYYVQFGGEGGANAVTGLQLIGLRATFQTFLAGMGDQ